VQLTLKEILTLSSPVCSTASCLDINVQSSLEELLTPKPVDLTRTLQDAAVADIAAGRL
jgi:hypothetical protein